MNVVYRVPRTAPTKLRSGPGARGGSARATPRGRGARGPTGALRGSPPGSRPPWRRLPTHTTRADIMIWRQSEY